MYVDRGSSSEIMYEHCFNRFRPEVRNRMVPATTPLVGFSGEIIWPLGKAKSKENPGGSIYSSQNAKIPSHMWNGHIIEQQDYSTRMHNGFRARSAAAPDMTGVPRHIVENRLNTREGCLPVRQKKRGQAPERNKPIYEEVEKLVDPGIMKEVHYHSWLSNPVMVKEHDGSWRMYVDFKDLNKACPKDGYPLPKINWKVESLCGYPFKCFLDVYKGYHQIKMAEEDEEKIAFITSQGIFCYSKMPFGLKNAGATYQCLVDKAFQKQIGLNLEVYVDGLVIKSCTEQEVEAVLSFPSPKCLKDVQRLNGKLASLNKFLSKSAKKSLPLFKTLKKCTKKSDFQWTVEAEMAFKQMKTLIAELPMLTTPNEKEELVIYLAAAKEAVSTVLMMERDGKQVPIYFISCALHGSEINYTPMEKITCSGRLLKWRFELEEYGIHHRPRPSVKGHILADFIVERPDDDPFDTPMEDKEELPDP
nr:reverse transcriptase domain-containing protein [Tanacetum cinerariifolium]